jgi:hypothetical protein
MSKENTYGVQYNVTDRSYTVIVNGVTGRNFKTVEAANAYIVAQEAK